MKELKAIAILSSLLVIQQQVLADEITRFHYSPLPTSIHQITVNNGRTPPPTNGLPQIVINNLISAGEVVRILPLSRWSGNNWTHLNEFTSDEIFQKAISRIGGNAAYGNTMVQTSGSTMGLHLNTFGTNLPSNYPATSLQYLVGWGAGKQVWFPNEKLCVSGTAKIATSYGIGQAVNQAMYTMHFTSTSNQAIFFNVLLFDSRSPYHIMDSVIWDQQDTNTAIVISHAQSQYQNNPNIKYSSSIDEYGDYLIPFQSGDAPSINGHYGFCINSSQFSRAITDINQQFNTDYDTLPANWTLDVVLIGPEINTRPSVYQPKGNGHIGMSVGSMYVYNKLE